MGLTVQRMTPAQSTERAKPHRRSTRLRCFQRVGGQVRVRNVAAARINIDADRRSKATAALSPAEVAWAPGAARSADRPPCVLRARLASA